MWLDVAILADHTCIVFALDDDYFFGVLQSRVHQGWARRRGTQLREAESGSRYTPSTSFGTFPFPWPPGQEPEGDARVLAIAEAARELGQRRNDWLNVPGLSEVEARQRTLTNPYNLSPGWLGVAHERLDRAVLDAYGWRHNLTANELLERLLALNLSRAPA